MEPIQVFDLQRMFLGTETSWLYLLEIAFRTAFMFIWTLANVRFLGKRNIGQLTPFEFLITFALGSAVGDPMFMPDVPLLHGMTVVTMVVALERVLSYLSRNSKAVEKAAEGSATLIIRDGKIFEKKLEDEMMPRDELFARLRLEGIENTGQVKYAFLEVSGKLSVIQFEKGKELKGISTIKSK